MPEIRYETYGPFEVPRGHEKVELAKLKVAKKQLKRFWSAVEGDEVELRSGRRLGENGLSRARGIYVFANSAGGGFTPWYVGKTNQTGGFRGECFGPHKLLHYNDILQNSLYSKGTPVMFLIARMNGSGQDFSASKGNDREIDWLEAEFIQLALAANPDLVNEKRTKFVRELIVPGVIGNENTQLSPANKDLQRVLNLKTMKRKKRATPVVPTQATEEMETIIVPEAHEDFEADDSVSQAFETVQLSAPDPVFADEAPSVEVAAPKIENKLEVEADPPKPRKKKKRFGIF